MSLRKGLGLGLAWLCWEACADYAGIVLSIIGMPKHRA